MRYFNTKSAWTTYSHSPGLNWKQKKKTFSELLLNWWGPKGSTQQSHWNKESSYNRHEPYLTLLKNRLLQSKASHYSTGKTICDSTICKSSPYIQPITVECLMSSTINNWGFYLFTFKKPQLFTQCTWKCKVIVHTTTIIIRNLYCMLHVFITRFKPWKSDLVCLLQEYRITGIWNLVGNIWQSNPP